MPSTTYSSTSRKTSEAWPWKLAAALGRQHRRLWHSCSTLRVKGWGGRRQTMPSGDLRRD